ncbi:efflux RND transporter permease subunit [Haloplanus aerogenes]|uniref:Putative RND superfamily exporter protein n=1 Tax=Haloplanus aerogenes TaxID=660522 RepID=A0A3M0EDB1_9EURY|nr:MMPL family transporter [Haloplanus aerogenes]AZH25895.1 RND transporter [Haloplanus aerogenes]RMB25650.1 putative RND superfamily exporter protein [Haloplanus aerogenes]
MNYQWLIDRVDHYIVDYSRTVVIVFLLATVVFSGGLGSIETESGQQQFIEDLPSFQALEDVQRDFGATFSQVSTTTTLVQSDQNVLSKPALLDMLRTQEQVAESDPLRVEDTSSAAQTVALTLDPDATTTEEQIRAVERATPGEIDRAVRRAADRRESFRSQLSTDFNRRSASASATEATVTHRAGPGAGSEGGPGGASEFPANKKERIDRIVRAETSGSTIRVLGTAPDTTTTTLTVVLPIALVLIVIMLAVAYRDLVDLLIGLAGIIMTLIWTFGFIGLVGIPFAVLLIAVPPILIAVGIDFGIHAINRYREERVKGTGVSESMRLTTDQVSVAFFIVMGTSAIGFLSNVISAFPPTRDFGVTAAAGIVFTFLIFGIFVPATKVSVDRLRETYPIPTITQTPFGSESSPLGRALSGGVTIAERAPTLFVLLVVLSTAGAGVYATGVETGFSPDDFQPAAETPEYLQYLPEPIRPPAEFEYVKIDNFRDENFEQEGQVLMYVEGPMRQDTALERLHQAGNDPPPTFVREGWHAESRSIVTLIRSHARNDSEFQRVVERNDRNDNGIPDDDLPQVYAALEESAGEDRVAELLSEERRSALVVYTVDGDEADDAITDDAYRVAGDLRYRAQPTGNSVIFDEALALVLETVIQSLVLTLVGASLFLILIYWIVEGRPSLGIANVIPILVTVVALVASMRLFGIKFNAINGTILAIAVGLGIDYSVHVVHRFVDEYAERDLYPALRRTVVGTGGALTGSMLTTVFGVGVLALALNPAVGVFGILIALSVLYAYLTSIIILPSILVLWARFVDENEERNTDMGDARTAGR